MRRRKFRVAAAADAVDHAATLTNWTVTDVY
jgi:hypothetical protein